MPAFLLLAALVAAMPISESDVVDVAAAVQHQLHVADLDASMAYEKPYVVAFWSAGDGHAAGEALLARLGQGNWKILKITTGSLRDAALLQSLGVPAATAKALVKDLTEFKAP